VAAVVLVVAFGAASSLLTPGAGCVYTRMDTMPDTLPAVVEFNYDTLAKPDRAAVLEHTNTIHSLFERTARDIWEIGNRLIDVKERIGHGRFGDWLRAEFEMHERTAQNFMNVARAFKSETVSDLPFAPKVLYMLSAPSVPGEAREEVVARAKGGETITPGKAKSVIVKLRPAAEPKPAYVTIRCAPAPKTESQSTAPRITVAKPPATPKAATSGEGRNSRPLPEMPAFPVMRLGDSGLAYDSTLDHKWEDGDHNVVTEAEALDADGNQIEGYWWTPIYWTDQNEDAYDALDARGVLDLVHQAVATKAVLLDLIDSNQRLARRPNRGEDREAYDLNGEINGHLKTIELDLDEFLQRLGRLSVESLKGKPRKGRLAGDSPAGTGLFE
jgi:hypothetical protein